MFFSSNNIERKILQIEKKQQHLIDEKERIKNFHFDGYIVTVPLKSKDWI